MSSEKQKWKKDSYGIKMPVNGFLGVELKLRYYNTVTQPVRNMFVSHTVYPGKNDIFAGGELTDKFYYPIQ